MNNIDNKRRHILDALYQHYGNQNWWEDVNWVRDLVSMILIQRTTDANAKRALVGLEPYLTLEKLNDLPIETLEKLIYSTGFYRQKSKSIKGVVAWFLEKGDFYFNNSDISTDALRKELLMIRGVGYETADVILLYIFKRNVFVADAYARRLFERMGLGVFNDYESMRKAMMPLVEGVDQKLCREWHAVIDEHGKLLGRNRDLDESWLWKELTEC